MAEPAIKLDPIVVKPYDVNAALDEGYTYKDIATHLSEKNNYNLDGAIKEGYNYQEISKHLSNLTSSNKKLEEPKSESYQKSRLDRDAEGNVIGTFDKDTFVGSTLNKIIPQPDKIPAQLMRQLELTRRGVMEGAAEGLDFIASPVTGMMNLAGANFPTLAEGLEKEYKEQGLAYPENSLERIANQATKFVPITGVTNAVVKASQPMTQVGKNIQQSLLENEGRQLISGGLMGGGMQYAAEQGSGMAGQLGTGLAASIAPFVFKGKSSIQKPVFKQELKNADKQKKLELKNNDTINDYEAELASNLKAGLTYDESVPLALKKLRLPREKINQAYINTNRELNTFKNKDGDLDYVSIENTLKNKRIADYKPQNMLDKITENWHTKLKSITEPIANRVRKYDFDEHLKTAEKLEIVKPFVIALNTIKKDNPKLYREVSKDLYSGNHDNVSRVMADLGDDALQGWNQTQLLLNDTRNSLLDSGFKIFKKDEYFPRHVKDVEKLRRTLNVEQKNNLDLQLDESVLAKVANQIKKDNPKFYDDLTDAEILSMAKDKIKQENLGHSYLGDERIASITDSFLRGYGSNKLKLGSPRYTKERVIDNIDDTLLPFYTNPEDAITDYVRSTTKQIEKRKLFGQDIPDTFQSAEDIRLSLGTLLRNEGKDLSQKQLDEVRELMISRFGKGEQSAGKLVSTLKDFIYMGTLANPLSAGTQAGDVAQTAFQFKDGVKKSLNALFSTKEVKIKDMGLDEVITGDLSKEKRWSSDLLSKFLKGNLFKAVDKLGKETNFQTALKEGRALSKNKEGQKVLENKWSKVFGDDYDSFIKDLQSGKVTDNVKYYLWHNLADQQPISLSEMPKYYLDMPNGRAFYALQSFALKQLDVVKRNIINEYKNGNKKKAVWQGARYSMIVGGGNTAVDYAKDTVVGKNIDPYNIPRDILLNTVKIFGVNDYTLQGLSEGKVADWFNTMWMPPLSVVGAPVQDAAMILNKAFDPDEEFTAEDFYKSQTLPRVPYVGTIIKQTLGGGSERYNERLEKQETDNIFGIE